MNNFYVYIVRCADGTYYTGYAADAAARLKTHNSGKGAKYTRSRLPVALVYVEKAETKGDAMRREAQIKRLPRAKKEELIILQK